MKADLLRETFIVNLTISDAFLETPAPAVS